MAKVKTMYFIRVSNVLSMKILIGDTILTSPTGDRTAILRGYLNLAKVYLFAVQRE